MPESQKPRKPMNQTPVWERPVKGPVSRAAQLPPSNLKRNLLIGAGATAAAGGTYYLHRRGRTKEKEKTVTASKNLINPFEEVVVFGKAYPVALPVPRSTTIRALVPTGSHVGHGNALKHVRNSKGGGGRATRLERYTGGHADQRVGPFGKSLTMSTPGMMTAARVAASGPGKPSMPRGLGMIANMKKPTGVPSPLKEAGRVKSSRSTLAGRQNTIRQNALPGQMRGLSKAFSFGSFGSRGKKLAAVKKPTGPQPPDYDFGPGPGKAPDLWAPPKKKTGPSSNDLWAQHERHASEATVAREKRLAAQKAQTKQRKRYEGMGWM